MAQQRYNPETGQFEDPIANVDPSQMPGGSAATNTGIVAPTPTKKPFDRAAYQAGWGGGSAADLANYNNSWDGVTTQNDTSYLPTHEVLDMVFDTGGKNGYGWTGKGSWSGSPDAAHTAADPGGGGGGLGAPAAAASSAAAGSSGGSAFQDQLRQIILSQLGQLQQPSSINDPALKGQSDAYRVATERAAQQSRGALAERSAFNGLNSGGAGSGSMDTGILGINEQAGQHMAANDAGLVGAHDQQKRQSLMTLLNMALASGDAESVRALQMQLAQMDSQYKYASLGQNQSQFNDQLGFSMGRNAEDDYRWRVLQAMGGA